MNNNKANDNKRNNIPRNIKYKVECFNANKSQNRDSFYIINVLDNGFGGTDKVRLIVVEDLNEYGKFIGKRQIPYAENNTLTREVMSEFGKMLRNLESNN